MVIPKTKFSYRDDIPTFTRKPVNKNIFFFRLEINSNFQLQLELHLSGWSSSVTPRPILLRYLHLGMNEMKSNQWCHEYIDEDP